MLEIKLTKRWWASLCLLGAMVLAAVLINAKASFKEICAEITWKLSTVMTFLLGYLGTGAEEGMRYLNNNSLGISALCGIIGLAFSVYFQWKSSNKPKDEE